MLTFLPHWQIKMKSPTGLPSLRGTPPRVRRRSSCSQALAILSKRPGAQQTVRHGDHGSVPCVKICFAPKPLISQGHEVILCTPMSQTWRGTMTAFQLSSHLQLFHVIQQNIFKALRMPSGMSPHSLTRRLLDFFPKHHKSIHVSISYT